jgi:CUB domain
VWLVFDEINTEMNADFIYVYDGIDNSAAIINEYHGAYESSKISLSTQQYMFVRFTTDYGTTNTGFHATCFFQPPPTTSKNFTTTFDTATQSDLILAIT